MKRYAIHPDYYHNISAHASAKAYNLCRDEWIIWDEERPETYRGRKKEVYIHLYSRAAGDYKL